MSHTTLHTHNIQDTFATPPVHFTVGEALSYAFGAVPVTSDCILRTNFLSLADEFAILRGGDQAPVATAGEAMDVAGASAAAEVANADLVRGPVVVYSLVNTSV